jgi:Family of unknown function (DUF6345)
MTRREKNSFASRTQRSVAHSTPALAPLAKNTTQYLGGYAVSDFSACPQLPPLDNTIDDVAGWLSASADYQEQNFFYGDTDVQEKDFEKGTDLRDSSLPAGKDGIESVLAAYVATHGGRDEANTYFLFDVGKKNNKCMSVDNYGMALGNNGSIRYLFLATCDSVSKDAPGNVWFRAAKGLRAVFGYDGTIQDSAKYGKRFFQEWKKGKATTTQAFLDASWSVDHDQVAVAAWFGNDEASATTACDEEGEFQTGKVTAKFVAYAWHGGEAVQQLPQIAKVKNTILLFAPPSPLTDPNELLEAFAGHPTDQPPTLRVNPNDQTYTTQDGIQLIRNNQSGSLDVTYPQFFQRTSAVTLSDQELIDKATTYVRGFSAAIPGARSAPPLGPEVGLFPSALRRKYFATSEDGAQTKAAIVTDVTVVFRQTVNGVPSIGTGGVVEVTMNSTGALCRARIVTRDIASSIDPSPQGPDIDVVAMTVLAVARAKAEFGSRAPDCQIIKTEFGYYSDDDGETQGFAEPSFRVVLEISGGYRDRIGAYTRRYEKVYAARELSGTPSAHTSR